jgi:hypothetical protein
MRDLWPKLARIEDSPEDHGGTVKISLGDALPLRSGLLAVYLLAGAGRFRLDHDFESAGVVGKVSFVNT